MAKMLISVQEEDFNVAEITQQLCAERSDIGATVTFCGLVRDQSPDKNLKALHLEHYPGMTEKALETIAKTAKQRWDIENLAIIHRIGELKPAENIVMVTVISAHRKEAYKACEFIMDFLKTQAPFWKKEITQQGEKWVKAKMSDQQAAKNWS